MDTGYHPFLYMMHIFLFEMLVCSPGVNGYIWQVVKLSGIQDVWSIRFQQNINCNRVFKAIIPFAIRYNCVIISKKVINPVGQFKPLNQDLKPIHEWSSKSCWTIIVGLFINHKPTRSDLYNFWKIAATILSITFIIYTTMNKPFHAIKSVVLSLVKFHGI